MSPPSLPHDHLSAFDDGAWELHGASPDPKEAAPHLRGRLDVRPGLLDSRLALTIESLAVDARLASVDDLGEWHFEGTAARGERRAPVTVHARHNGVYRHGERATAWLSLRAESPPAGGRSQRRGLLRTRPRDRSLFEVEVNAEVPA